MSEEYNNVFFIPQNFTDSGKSFYGMFNTRNLVEAIGLLILIGYPELKFITLAPAVKIVIMILSLLPVVLFALIGIDGDSLLQYLGHMFAYFKNRRKMHFKRVGYKYVENQKNKNKK